MYSFNLLYEMTTITIVQYIQDYQCNNKPE